MASARVGSQRLHKEHDKVIQVFSPCLCSNTPSATTGIDLMSISTINQRSNTMIQQTEGETPRTYLHGKDLLEGDELGTLLATDRKYAEPASFKEVRLYVSPIHGFIFEVDMTTEHGEIKIQVLLENETGEKIYKNLHHEQVDFDKLNKEIAAVSKSETLRPGTSRIIETTAV